MENKFEWTTPLINELICRLMESKLEFTTYQKPQKPVWIRDQDIENFKEFISSKKEKDKEMSIDIPKVNEIKKDIEEPTIKISDVIAWYKNYQSFGTVKGFEEGLIEISKQTK